MRRFTLEIAGLGACAVAVVALAGCSTDSVIWGSEGAEVRAVAEEFIGDAAAAADPESACADASLRVGEPEAWEGLAAGEPEEYAPDQPDEQGDLSPTWRINLSPDGSEKSTGTRTVPTELFLRGDGDELCVIEVSWGVQTTSP